MTDTLKPIRDICERPNSLSQFFPNGGVGYKSSVHHYLESSCEIATAAVEPGSVADLAAIMSVLANNRDIQFAVKGGGHSSNPTFSSTTGIQISMSRFNKITYNERTTNVDVQAGCIFDDVYKALQPTGRNIVGGSGIAGIGIAGWLLGGGYSMKTNQFGLGIDNIVGFQIVLPNGTVENVTEHSNSDLFWAVKGGGNNFGIIVQFTLRTHEQSAVYGGVLVYEIGEVKDVKNAIVDFVERPGTQDPKAAIEAAFRYYNNPGGEQFKLTVQYFYDGPKPRTNPFQQFFDIPHTSPTAGTLADETTYLDFDQALSYINDCNVFEFDNVVPSLDAPRLNFNLLKTDVDFSTRPTQPIAGMGEIARGRWGSAMVAKYTRDLVNEAEKQAKKAAKHLMKHGGKTVFVGIWPFVQEAFDNSSPAAWPHEKGMPNGPLRVNFLWEGKENDTFWVEHMKRTLEALEAKVQDHSVKPLYSNTTLAERTNVAEVYRGNLKRLSEIRRKTDPADVMGRAGGFRIPL